MSISRSQQETQDIWDLSPLFPSVNAWKHEFEKESKIEYATLFSRFKKSTSFSPKQLCSLYDVYFECERRLKKLYTWAHLYHDQDIANDDAKQNFQRIVSLYHTFSENVAWVEPKILSLPKETLQSFVQSKELSSYKMILERLLRLKEHTLSTEEEELIAMSHRALDASHHAFSAINDADFCFQDVSDTKGVSHALTHGSYGVLLRSPDRKLRKNAFESMHSQYKRFENTMCELLHGETQKHLFEAKAHKYSSCLEASLWPKNIPTSVYTALIETVHKKIDLLHRYVELKKRVLKIKELHPWDLYIPIVKQKPILFTFEEAIDLVIASCAPLGEEYVDQLREGLTSKRWVDRFENTNKRSGAYSSGCYDSYPYILMNFKGTLRDVFVLAHEAGHSMHSDLSRKQPYCYADYPIFLAEIASTFNENLLSRYLIQQAQNDPKARAVLINEKLEEIRTTLFRQTMFAEFELFLHERVEQGLPFTPQILSEKFICLNQFYYGKALTVDPLLGVEWARIPHFYYNFYVYQYATGVSAACALAEKVVHGKKKARDDYLSFLSAGSSKFPLELLKSTGLDMTRGNAVLRTLLYFEELIDSFESTI